MDNTNKRRYFTPKEKLQVVLESYQRDTTIEAVCRKYCLVRSVINRWREEFQQGAENVFIDKRNPAQKAKSLGYEPGQSPEDLKKIIGELTVQNEILKKVPGLLGSR
jgi:transposase-like protein